jgi:hypothetical protein
MLSHFYSGRSPERGGRLPGPALWDPAKIDDIFSFYYTFFWSLWEDKKRPRREEKLVIIHKNVNCRRRGAS